LAEVHALLTAVIIYHSTVSVSAVLSVSCCPSVRVTRVLYSNG